MISYPAPVSACQTCPRSIELLGLFSSLLPVFLRFDPFQTNPRYRDNDRKRIVHFGKQLSRDSKEMNVVIFLNKNILFRPRTRDPLPWTRRPSERDILSAGYEEGKIFSTRRRRGAMGKLSWSCYDTILSYLWTRDVGSNVAGDMTGAHGTECCNTPRVKNSCSSDGGP